ncbi:hypothetical protein [Rhodococcus sp. SGAir0479]|uniref:hypothetical protein n=1 Tax=Rhodococcus sp. SGAir0479 TaxID=2567884 RepID=UPI0010CD3D36|nr:hypothetical protein [Rhodococcus sp. SGAir0479]QCQ90501.1 hypothetical protein E7742_04175 [Rhodococcus sp. SGAir0479]
MGSFDRVQHPVEWRSASFSIRETAALTLLAAIGCAAMAIGVVGGLDGRPMVLRYGSAYGCLVVLVAAFGVLSRRTGAGGSVRTVDVESGTASAIRQSRLLWGVLVAMTVCCALLTVGPALEIYLNAATPGIPGATVIFGVSGILFGSFLIVVVARLVRPGAVMLTPDGHHRGWSFHSYLPWESVAGVKAAYSDHRMILLIGFANAHWTRRYTTPIWRIDKRPPVPMIELDCRRFAMDDLLLLQFVSFYADDPTLRRELGTDAARARFAARDFG